MANPEGLATMSENAKVKITEARKQRREQRNFIEPVFHLDHPFVEGWGGLRRPARCYLMP